MDLRTSAAPVGYHLEQSECHALATDATVDHWQFDSLHPHGSLDSQCDNVESEISLFDQVSVIAPVSVIDQVSFLLQHTSSFNEVRGTPEARIALSYLPSLIVYLINSLLLPYLIDVSLCSGDRWQLD